MRVTIKDIARLSGVSTTTVSKIINKKDESISEGTRRRVLAIMADHEYTPNPIAQTLVTKKSNSIGIVIPDIRNPFFPEMTRGAEDCAQERGYNLIICNTDDDVYKQEQYIKVLQKKMVDGIILTPSSSSRESQWLASASLPILLVDRDIAVNNLIGRIVVDNKKGGFLAGSHLLERGARHIGFLSGGDNFSPSTERWTGFQKAMSQHGVPLREEWCLFGSFQSEFGFSAMGQLLDQYKELDGVFCASDTIAIGAMRAIFQRGLKIPQDVKVVGFDDIYIAKYLNPALTTIRQPIYEIGHRAATLLIDSMEQGSLQQKETFFELDTELVVRQTT